MNWHDTYEIPLTDSVTSSSEGATANGIRYAEMDDHFYTGETEPGVSNLGYHSQRDSFISTYEEIVQENERQQTLSTFTSTSDLA